MSDSESDVGLLDSRRLDDSADSNQSQFLAASFFQRRSSTASESHSAATFNTSTASPAALQA